MDFFYKLKTRYSKYVVKNLMAYFSMLYVIGFVLQLVGDGSIYYNYLSLDIGAILSGQIWRLVTWLCYPPSYSAFWGLIMIFLYYSLGSSLEKIWGSFNFNVFMFMGILLHIVGAFFLYIFSKGSIYLWGITPYNLNLSIFLAYALTFPENEFYLYFVIKIKAKILALFYLLIMGYGVLKGSPSEKFTIVATLLNIAIFYFITSGFKNNYRKEKQKKDVSDTVDKIIKMTAKYDNTSHRCKVCGKTSKDNSDMEFRYCSKCLGECEYCSDHIFTHIHVK